MVISLNCFVHESYTAIITTHAHAFLSEHAEHNKMKREINGKWTLAAI